MQLMAHNAGAGLGAPPRARQAVPRVIPAARRGPRPLRADSSDVRGPASGDQPEERKGYQQAASAGRTMGDRELDLESGDNPEERGAGPASEEAPSHEPSAAVPAADVSAASAGAEGQGRGEDYGRFGRGDDEGAAEGGFRGGHVAEPKPPHAGEAQEGQQEGGRMKSAAEMGRAAGEAMRREGERGPGSEVGGPGGCVQGGEISPPERYPGEDASSGYGV